VSKNTANTAPKEQQPGASFEQTVSSDFSSAAYLGMMGAPYNTPAYTAANLDRKKK
jgi:hypothetical protein